MTTMKYGLVLPYGEARTVAKLCQMAEEAGWDGCFLGDATGARSVFACSIRVTTSEPPGT